MNELSKIFLEVNEFIDLTLESIINIYSLFYNAKIIFKLQPTR